jgi:lysophospholipase L1-like esterase
MKPWQVLIFLLSVLTGLAILMFIFPKNGIKINKNIKLQFISWNEFTKPIKHKDISEILSNNNILADTIKSSKEKKTKVLDTVIINGKKITYTPIDINIDSTIQKIELPKNNDTLLNNFFKKLVELQTQKNKIHILHYGDSQIEDDRMTSYLRYRLQRQFGGFGCGFHPGIEAFKFTEPMLVAYSNNWLRYKLFPHKDTLVKHNRFGLIPMFSQFKAINDTTNDTISAWIKFSLSPTAYHNVKKYKIVKLFYGYNKTDINLKIINNKKIIYKNTLKANKRLEIKTWKFKNTPKNLKFIYTGTSSPQIFGYSFESPTGIFVDNLAVRGASGLFFGKMNLNLIKQIANNLNVKLILLQFGGNAVGRDSAEIRKYVHFFGYQIKYLHKILPNTAIIVIGPADMSQKFKNNYITRTKLPYLIKLLKNEALKQNCAFWNTYKAMGGKNSMPSWVFHNPPLAEKDFVHFSPNGAKIIAIMFYKALMLQYKSYLKTKIISK